MSRPAEVTESPVGARGRRPGVVLGLTIVIAALAVLSASAGQPPRVVSTPATRFAPSDGYRLRYTSGLGTLSGDWAVDVAASLLNQGPAQLYRWLNVTELDWNTAVLARLSSVQADASGTVTDRSDDFYSIGTDGIRAEITISGDGTAQMFIPGRLDLSATPSADRTWTSSGVLAVLAANGKVSARTYRADYSSAAATGAGLDGCIVVSARQLLDGKDAATWQDTWCPGRGIIGFTSAGTTWTSVTDSVTASPGPAGGFDWSGADGLAFSPRKVNNVGDQILLGLGQAPASLPDGTAVAIQTTTSDVVAIDTSAAVPPSRWRARPGGRPTSVSTLGSLTAVTTTDRELIVYGSDGDWRWRAPLSDVTIVPPVRIGDVIAVAGLDGSLTGYDLSTGVQRWRRGVGVEIRVPMAVAADRLAVIDQTGALSCLDASGHLLWDTAASEAESIAITSGASPVVVVPASGAPRINAYSLADGASTWLVRTPITARNLIGLDGQVVVRDGNRTVAMDAATGATRWTWDAERTYNGAGGADRVLLVTGSRLVLLDSDGRQVRNWPVDVGTIDGNSTWLTTSAGHVLLFGPRGLMLGVTG